MNGSVRQQHIGNSFSVTLSCCTKCFLGPNWGKHCRGEIILTRESQRRKTIFYRAKTVLHWSRHFISYGQCHRAINSLTRNLKTCALFVVNLLWFSKMSPLKTVLSKLNFCHFVVVTMAQLVVQCIFFVRGSLDQSLVPTVGQSKCPWASHWSPSCLWGACGFLAWQQWLLLCECVCEWMN